MKKFTKYLKYADLAMAGLALISLIMIFIPAVSYKDTSYSGWNLIFGHSETTSGILSATINYFSFSFLNLLTVILTLGVIACSVISYIKKNELFYLIATACALVAAIFFLLMKVFAIPAESVLMEAYIDNASLSAGPIIAAVCLFLATACGVVKKIFSK